MFFDWLFETKVINICVGVAIQPESSIKAGFHSVSIGSDWTFFQFVLSTPPDQKKFKILQLFIIRVADHRFKLEQKIGTESPCAGSILFRSGPTPCLFSGVEIGV